MAFGAPMTRPRSNLSVFFHAGFLLRAIPFRLLLVISCALFCVAACEPSSANGMQQQVGFDACDPYRDGSDSGIKDIYGANFSFGYYPENSSTNLNIEDVCGNSHLFCFPSTLRGFLPEEFKCKAAVFEVFRSQFDTELPMVSSRFCTRRINNSNSSSDYGMFKLSSGRAVSCSIKSGEGIHHMPSTLTRSANQNDLSSSRGSMQNDKDPSPTLIGNSRMIRLSSVDGSFPDVEISPAVLDWGQQYLYLPSVAYLTVANTCNHSVLHVYEPFSTNMQFYSCNDGDFELAPGEVASICFVFLGNSLGLSSAHLILQTSSGGFFVQAKGFTIESPYGLQPLIGLDGSFTRLHENLSLFNPYYETLYVKEVTVWTVVTLGNTSITSAGSCIVQSFLDTDEHSMLSRKDRLYVRSSQLDSPLMSIRLHGNWEIGPRSSETSIEIDFLFNSVGNLFGAVALHLLRPSQDKTDIVMVPLQAGIDGKAACNHLSDSVSVMLEALVPCDASGTVVFAVSLSNLSPHTLSVAKIAEVTESKKLFKIRYVEGLILFPETITKVALITSSQLPSFLSVDRDTDGDCELHIMTNDSINPLLVIPCLDIVHSFLKHQSDSSVGHGHERIGCVGGGNGIQPPPETKGLEIVEAEERVLGNWKTQGKLSGTTVLDDHEVLFPMVQVGNHHSKWITVKNPTEQPVVMQLILNSGEIIDECRDPDGHVQFSSPTSSVQNESMVPNRYGFSLPKSSLTEVYVHPYGRASIGPVIFHPSKRCGWRSSALIRNNLSGVEWLTLRGFGGLFSLVLHEGSEPTRRLEFNFSMLFPFNVSPPDMIFSKESSAISCSLPLFKELYAKNTGDLSLEVRKIEVSGTDCGLDGFLIHNCDGFTLEPGESRKLLISYQTDSSAAVVHRDLELAMTSGILVIPMKATLPFYMLNLCGKSGSWTRVKKSSLAFILFVTSLMLCWLLSQVMGLCFQDDLFRREKNSIAMEGDVGKRSSVPCIERKCEASVSSKMDGLWSLCWDINSSETESVSEKSACQDGKPAQGLPARCLKPSSDNHGRMNGWSDTPTAKDLSSSILSKSEGIDSSKVPEAMQPSNLIVRITKEKRRRRRRKGSGAGLAGLSEVSGSQSGNSTPSSPLSPVTSTPSQSGSLSPSKDQSTEAKNPFSKLANRNGEKGRAFEPSSTANKLERGLAKKSGNNFSFPALEQPSAPKISGGTLATSSDALSCASRPAAQVSSPRPLLAPSSSIASHARAPGSKSCIRKTLLFDKKAACENEFTYDIWGDHFRGLHLSREELVATVSSATESNSDSFFVRGPQALDTKAKLRPVSCFSQEA